jgi:hypothetical protein
VQQPVSFQRFGGLRLDLPLDEAGPENAIYLRDVDWDGSLGKIRSRDGFQKLKAAEATGPYKGLFPHSAARLLATKRVSAGEVKICAIDREGVEKVTASWPSTAAKSSFTRFGTPSASYTYGRAALTSAKPVRFDGAAFTEPTATVDGAAGKEMPRGNLLATWPAGGNRLVVANTGATGGPNGATSSASHVWFSEPGNAEGYESTAFVQLSPGDGEEITAVCVWGGRVFVFKETKYFIFYGVSVDGEGEPIFNFTEVSMGDGSRMKRAAASALEETSDQIATAAPTGVYFCTTDGIYVTTGGEPTKISQALKPLEETTPFDGPMAEFLNGSTETCRWPAAGIVSLGQRLIVKRYEYLFVYDIPTDAWTCWKQTTVSLAVWTGLTGAGGVEGSEKLPGTAEDAAGVGSIAWTNPNNAKLEDNIRATASLKVGEISHYLKVTNFGFEIPESATVTGIKVTSLRKGGSGSSEGLVVDNQARLVKAGVVQASDKSLATGYPLEVAKFVTYGGPEDLWGGTWAASDINGTGFGFATSAKNADTEEAGSAQIDVIKVTVYFTISGSGGFRPRLFVTSSKFIYWTGPTAEEQGTSRQPEYQPGFYDAANDDEKEFVTAKLWGTGTVGVAVARDFGPVGPSTEAVLGTSPEIAVREFNKTAVGTVHSHRISGVAPWSVQRLARYVREDRDPTTKTR